MSKKIVQDKKRTINLSKKLIIVPAALLIGLLSVVGGTKLAYVWVGDKNMSIEMVRLGLAKVEIMQDRRPLIHQEELQKI